MDAHQHDHDQAADAIDRADISLDTDPELPELLVEIPVRVTGPVRTQDIGVDLVSSTSWTMDATTPELALSAQDTRSYSEIISTVEDFYFGPNKAAVKSGNAGIWPAGVPLRTSARNACYVLPVSSTPTVLSVFNYAVR